MISLIYEDGEKTLVWRRVTNPSQKLPQFNPCSRFRFSFYIISSVGVSAYLRLWMDLSYIEYAILRGLQNKIILRAKQRERKNKEIICSAKSIFSTLSSFCKQRHSEHFTSSGQDDVNSLRGESCSLTLTSAQTLSTVVLADLEPFGGHKTSLKHQIR